MKTILKIIAGIFVILLLGRMCSSDSDSSASNDGGSSVKTETDRFEKKHGLSAEAMQGLLEQDKAYLAEVIGKFNYQEDEFTGEGRYIHKQEKETDRNKTGLMVILKKDGKFLISSNYYGTDWLFHESITVKIDDRVINSSVVPFNDPNNLKENRDGYVRETVSYTDDSDRNLMFAVGSNPEKIIKIRFNGRNKTKDITLTSKQKEIIDDYSFLVQILASVSTKEAALRNQ